VDPNADQWHQGSITEFKSANSSDDGGTENANIATRKRPSDDQVQIPGQGMTPAGSPDSNLAASSNGIGPGGAAGATGATDPNAPPKPPAWLSGGSLPGMPAGQRGIGIPQAPTPQTGTNNGPTGSSDSGGGSVSSNGGYGSGPSTGGGFGGTPTTPTAPTGPPGYPGSANNGFGNNGFTQPGAQSNAANMINGLLTQPRPGGAPTGVGMQGIGGTVVGGLAGVASTYKGRGIKRYNDQEEYTKWEFFYDLGAEQAQAAQTQANMMNQGAKPGTSSSSSNTSSFSSVSPPTPPPPPPTTPQ
jgi:hypothetical protein